MGPIIVLAITFLLMWVLFILPQQRRVRAHQAMLTRLQTGDEVMTTSGIYGTVAALDDDIASVEIAPGTTVRMARAAIARRLTEDAQAAAEAAPPRPAGTAADRAVADEPPGPADT
jgi:preprotein translocase subunit YajC